MAPKSRAIFYWLSRMAVSGVNPEQVDSKLVSSTNEL
jgi:hypothetical protein